MISVHLVRYVILLILFPLILSGCNFIKNEDTAKGGGLEGETISIVGKAVYPGGALALGANVKLRSALNVEDSLGLEDLNSVTGLDGQFLIKGVLPGDYFLTLEDNNKAASFRDLRVDGQNSINKVLHVTTAPLTGRGFLRGKIIYPPGLPTSHTGLVQMPGLGDKKAIGSNGDLFLSNIPAGDYYLRIVYSSLGLTRWLEKVTITSGDTTDIKSFTLNNPGPENFNSWPSKLSLTLNTTKTGANIPDDIYKYPLMVRLDSHNFPIGQVGEPRDGADIRFSDEKGKTLSFEIDSWDLVNQSAILWVKLDTLFGNRLDQKIYLHYGVKDIFTPSKSLIVFDTALDYLSIWHFSNYNPGGSVSDGTFNRNHLSVGGIGKTKSPFGFGWKFGSGKEMATQANAKWIANDFTLAFWVQSQEKQLDTAVLARYELTDTSMGSFTITWLGKEDSLLFSLSKFNGSTRPVYLKSPAPIRTDWAQVAVTYESLPGIGRIFLNGEAQLQTFSTVQPFRIKGTGIFYLGSNKNNLQPFFGIIDEIRMVKSAWPANRIRLDYENQKINSGLIVFP